MSLSSSDHSLEDQLEDNGFYIENERWAICPGQVFIAKAILASTQVLLKTPLPELLTKEHTFFQSQMVSFEQNYRLPASFFHWNYLATLLTTIYFSHFPQSASGAWNRVVLSISMKGRPWSSSTEKLGIVPGSWIRAWKCERVLRYSSNLDRGAGCAYLLLNWSKCLLQVSAFPSGEKKMLLRTVDSLSFSEKSFLAHSIEKLEKLSFEHSPPSQQGLLK